MTATGQNVVTRSGDSRRLQFTVTDAAGAAVDLTGATITWALATKLGGTTLLTKTIGAGITVNGASAGQFYVAVDPADTASLAGTYYHEAEVVDALANKATVAVGTLTVIQDQIP